VKREFSAGGVVVRAFRARPHVAVIVTKKDAIALPKGHPDGEENAAQAALREVREETGLEAAVVEKLGDVRYWYARKGERRFKVVSFFLMRYRSGSVRDHDHEVKSAQWIPLEEAPERLSYPGERHIVRTALSRQPDTR